MDNLEQKAAEQTGKVIIWNTIGGGERTLAKALNLQFEREVYVLEADNGDYDRETWIEAVCEQREPLEKLKAELDIIINQHYNDVMSGKISGSSGNHISLEIKKTKLLIV